MKDVIDIYDCVAYRATNSELAQAILALPDESVTRRSHFFHGRYENLYVDIEQLPGLKSILEIALEKSAQILEVPVDNLKFGFWLNIMRQGDVTTLHSHDDDDELLSAVYYIQVPAHSGVFKLHVDREIREIEPVAGRFMFFDPSLPHEVSEHHNAQPRISIGINVGPIDR